VIPLDDHNDWFEREEVRTDLLIVHFEPDEGTQVVHLHFTCIECKFDERVQRASKGISQLEETARRLQKRFAQSAPEYPFRLRDLAEAVRSLAPLYRGHLPEFLLDLLWTNNPQVNLHLAEGEIKLILALYQIDDHLSEVQAMCRQHGYQLLSNEPVPFQHLAGLGGEHLCVYRSGSGVGQMFDRFVRWMADDL